MLTLRILWSGLWVYLDSRAIKFTIESSINWYNQDMEIISHIVYHALVLFIILGVLEIIQDCVLWNEKILKPYYKAIITTTDNNLYNVSKIMRYANS